MENEVIIPLNTEMGKKMLKHGMKDLKIDILTIDGSRINESFIEYLKRRPKRITSGVL